MTNTTDREPVAWRMVPVEPTWRMIDAGSAMLADDSPAPFVINIYRAMLRASPDPDDGMREALTGIWDVAERMNPNQTFNAPGRLARCAEYARQALSAQKDTER